MRNLDSGDEVAPRVHPRASVPCFLQQKLQVVTSHAGTGSWTDLAILKGAQRKEDARGVRRTWGRKAGNQIELAKWIVSGSESVPKLGVDLFPGTH